MPYTIFENSNNLLITIIISNEEEMWDRKNCSIITLNYSPMYHNSGQSLRLPKIRRQKKKIWTHTISTIHIHLLYNPTPNQAYNNILPKRCLIFLQSFSPKLYILSHTSPHKCHKTRLYMYNISISHFTSICKNRNSVIEKEPHSYKSIIKILPQPCTVSLCFSLSHKIRFNQPNRTRTTKNKRLYSFVRFEWQG